LGSLAATNRIFRFIIGYALCQRMIYSYLQKKEITDYNNRIAAHFWFHFLYSRLPKPGDVPKVQGTRGDFSVSGSQLNENKPEVNRAKVSTA